MTVIVGSLIKVELVVGDSVTVNVVVFVLAVEVEERMPKVASLLTQS